MKKIGIIGYGCMGSMLVTRFLKNKVMEPDQLMISTLLDGSYSHLQELKEEYERIEIAEDNKKLANECQVIFICVKPLEVKGVIEEIREHMRPGAHLVSSAASVPLDNIESIYKGKVTRVVPTITSKVDTGITLVCHNRYVEPGDAVYIEKLFNAISTVKIIAEEEIEIATNLTSTAPGLIAAIFREFVECGIRYSGFTRGEVETIVINTFYGISRLFYEGHMKFPDTVSQVATRGGITETGDEVIQRWCPPFFNELFDRTLGKFEEIKAEVCRQFFEAIEE